MCEIKINGDKIQKNILFLSENTVNLGKLTLILLQYKILDPNERERIRSENSEMDRASEMYLLLTKKVTHAVFIQVLQALNDTGNHHVADKLEAESRTESVNEITKAINNVVINDSYEVLGLKHDYLVLENFKIVNSGILTKIKFTFVQVTRNDIVEGFKHCRQLKSLILKDVNIHHNEIVKPETGEGYDRVLLPVLKQFIWEWSERSKKAASTESSIESLIFFYKIKNEKYWEIEDINSLHMNVFEMTFFDQVGLKRFIKVNNIEQSFQCHLEANLDAITTTLPYTPLKLYLEYSPVSLSRLPIDNNLKELTLWFISFQDRKSVEMNHDFFKNHQELECLHFGGEFAETVLDISSLPPKLKVLELNGIAVKCFEQFGIVCCNLCEVRLQFVRFINHNNKVISPPLLCLNKLTKVNNLFVDGSKDVVSVDMSKAAIIELNSLQKNLKKLSLYFVRIRINTCDNLFFAEKLVELELIGVRSVDDVEDLIPDNVTWVEQLKNLKLLTIKSGRKDAFGESLSNILDCECTITVNWKYLPSSLTHLMCTDVTLMPFDSDKDSVGEIPQTGNKFGVHLKELLFIDCMFIYYVCPSTIPVPLNQYYVLCEQNLKMWMTQFCPHLKGSTSLTHSSRRRVPFFSANYKSPYEIPKLI